MSDPTHIPELWRRWAEENGPVERPTVSEAEPQGDGVWFEFQVTAPPLTVEAMVALYCRCSGIAGWSARFDGGKVFLTPPAGYVVAHGEDGSRRLVKISGIRPMGISIRETA